MPDLEHTLLMAEANRGLCKCLDSRTRTKHAPPATPPPVPPTKKQPAPDNYWVKHDGQSKVFDLYIIHPDDEAAAVEEARREWGWDDGWGAYAWKGNNDAVFKAAVWPRILRPEHAPSKEESFVLAERVPDAFSNAFQEGVYIHEVLGHACMGLDHDDDHPSMHQSENLPPADRLALMAEVHEVHGYAYIRVRPWVPGVLHEKDADDIVVN